MYRLLLNDSDHGWCNMLREGATTCFEAWGKDQKWNTSLCHPWASAPVPVILEEIAGIHLSPEAAAILHRIFQRKWITSMRPCGCVEKCILSRNRMGKSMLR